VYTPIFYRPDHLERRWYQNQQQRQNSSGGSRLIRGLSGTKHMSDMYDNDDLMRLQNDDGTVAALMLDDVVLGGGYSGRNTVSLQFPQSKRTGSAKIKFQ
jgi:hypothetical protein